ncbi:MULTISPECIES: enoyl-CoA hydratase/isomerase family protein [unclassified Achromobacter]|uniref:enoyl-CoA hydratase/isomerase family protein n=1 Tax=unclassified Achromobacter TaxID=2626865 RepID=UPI001E2FA21B|nr:MULTISPECIES: enoyl-CoA hydratase/isomerase family protein [unclassified Achromobacter]
MARITLRRPAHANRLEPADLDVLMGFCAQLRQDSQVRAVVLEGEGRHFSAGYDIRRIMEIAGDSATGPLYNPFEALVDAFERLPQPTIARLHGGVYGGSTDLALACDFRIGTPATEMFMPAAQMGLLYYPSGLRRYTERLGVRHAKEMFLLGEKIDAAGMLRIGFLNELVPAEELDQRIAALTQRLCDQAPLAIRGAKQAIDALARGQFDLTAFKQLEAQTLRSADLKEGVAAWAEKRAPRFSGH